MPSLYPSTPGSLLLFKARVLIIAHFTSLPPIPSRSTLFFIAVRGGWFRNEIHHSTVLPPCHCFSLPVASHRAQGNHSIACFSQSFRLNSLSSNFFNPWDPLRKLFFKMVPVKFLSFYSQPHSPTKERGYFSPFLESGLAIVTCLLIKIQWRYVLEPPKPDCKKICSFHLGLLKYSLLEYLLWGKLTAMVAAQRSWTGHVMSSPDHMEWPWKMRYHVERERSWEIQGTKKSMKKSSWRWTISPRCPSWCQVNERLTIQPSHSIPFTDKITVKAKWLS